MTTKHEIHPHPETSSSIKESANKRSRITVEFSSNENEYKGYSFQTETPLVEVVDPDISAKDFFHKFISPRKPCVIKGLNSPGGEKMNVTTEDLMEISGDETVQVEKRYSLDESFGQNRTPSRQIFMKVSEFVTRISCEKESEFIYLSTQQPLSTSSKDEDKGIPWDPFQVPCTKLLQAGKIEKTLNWAGHLQLESCNLWMGASRNGSSSGLHHDYHDNFYLLLQGRKQFCIYSPDTAPYMETYGTIEKIHHNGVISYVGNELRPDGLPCALTEEGNDDDNQGSDGEEEEEIIVGKGFDYESSDEDAEFSEDSVDDFDELVGTSVDDTSSAAPDNILANNNKEVRPNHFSKIDSNPVNSKENEPFGKCKCVVVNLQAGETLFLPAGWFHAVTSFCSEGNAENSETRNVHMAINYWYYPPDRLESFERPYHKELPLDQQT